MRRRADPATVERLRFEIQRQEDEREQFLPANRALVQSVNGQTGIVTIDADDIGALPEAPDDGGTYARKDGEWVQAGTVTSVGLSPPDGFQVSESPITGAGEIELEYAPGYQGYTTAESEKLAATVTDAPTNGTPYARSGAAWLPLEGINSPYVLLKLPALSDQTGRILTDQAGRPLFSNNPRIPLAWVPGAQASVKDIYPLSALPPVTPSPREIYVSGTSGVTGIIPAYSDGTNWLRFSDNTPVN